MFQTMDDTQEQACMACEGHCWEARIHTDFCRKFCGALFRLGPLVLPFTYEKHKKITMNSFIVVQSGAKRLNMAEKDAAIKQFVKEGWLVNTPDKRGRFSLGVRISSFYPKIVSETMQSSLWNLSWEVLPGSCSIVIEMQGPANYKSMLQDDFVPWMPYIDKT